MKKIYFVVNNYNLINKLKYNIIKQLTIISTIFVILQKNKLLILFFDTIQYI